jgi:SAM-dependent methyltransferase
MKTVTREWDWWAHLFRVVHRSEIEGIREWDERLVAFLSEVLGLGPGSSVLDVACGSGEHTRGLARRGVRGVGLDIAPSLVAHCRERAEEAGLTGLVRYVEGDMRDLAAGVGEETFDAVTLLSGSFGFFDDGTNRRVLEGMAARLRPGGRLLLDCVPPARAPRERERSWCELAGGILFSETWYDPVTCTRTGTCRYLDADGVMNEWAEPERIRIYNLPEFEAILRGAGLEGVEAYGASELPPVPYDAEHPERLVVTARRP